MVERWPPSQDAGSIPPPAPASSRFTRRAANMPTLNEIMKRPDIERRAVSRPKTGRNSDQRSDLLNHRHHELLLLA
jgi:hypothetical protein